MPSDRETPRSLSLHQRTEWKTICPLTIQMCVLHDVVVKYVNGKMTLRMIRRSDFSAEM